MLSILFKIVNMDAKFYLAGKWDDHEDLSAKVAQIEADSPMRVTHAWMRKNIGLSIINDAISDIRGVQLCDVFIAVFSDPNYPYRGTFTELGAALALTKLVFIVCPDDTDDVKFSCRTNVFFHHPFIHHVKNWEQLLIDIGIKDKTGATPKKRLHFA